MGETFFYPMQLPTFKQKGNPLKLVSNMRLFKNDNCCKQHLIVDKVVAYSRLPQMDNSDWPIFKHLLL